MKKKSFRGIDGLLGISDSHSDNFERKKPKLHQEPYVTVTLRIKESTMDYIRRICYWDRKVPLSITDIVNKVLKDHVSEYVKKNGELKPIPEKGDYDS